MTHIRVIWRGTLPGGESWSTSAAYIPVGVQVAPQPQALMNAAATAIANAGLPSFLNSYLSPAGTLTSVRLEQRTASGALLVVGEGARSTPANGSGSATKPFQTSLVVSLRTAVPGRRGRGRMYWPALGASISATTLRLAMGSIEAMAPLMVTFLKGTGDLLQATFGGVAHVLTVHSKANASEEEVIALEVGDVLDVQRRRRDKAIENRVTAAFG